MAAPEEPDASWRDLPPSLLVSTARYYDNARDVLALESVCCAWRLALRYSLAVEDEIWLPILRKRFPLLDVEPVEKYVMEENEKRRVVECRPRKRNYSYRAAYKVQMDVGKLRAIKGVGSPRDMYSPGEKEHDKASNLSDYTITFEGIFGPDACALESDNAEEELKRRTDLNRYTWTGGMDRDCVFQRISTLTASDAPRFSVPSETMNDDFCYEQLRIYITSPSLVTYKLFQFDCRKMTCTINESLCGASEFWEVLYNERRSWKLPYEHREPEGGIQLQVSVTVGKSRKEQMLGLTWTSGDDELDKAMVLAYLNGDKVDLDDF